jgi:uncharacterized ferritin-like protein (DUF455 family)
MAAVADDLFSAALACLLHAEPEGKRALTAATAQAFRDGKLGLIGPDQPVPDVEQPGRPARPRLIAARHLPQRGLGSAEGRAAFVHAIAHIEFNAINLAWDAVHRFRGMPDAFYADWVAVADDEARHFGLLRERLRSLGFDYGDFDAHDGLWEMARKTADHCLARMALVPRVLEARGLDVTPGMIARLRGIGDDVTADILELILREEVAHVAAGTRWYRWCCARDGVDPQATFASLLREHALGALRGPFNRPARQDAGFSNEEMDLLDTMSASERT